MYLWFSACLEGVVWMDDDFFLLYMAVALSPNDPSPAGQWDWEK